MEFNIQVGEIKAGTLRVLLDVANEREHQIIDNGWTPEKDDAYFNGQLTAGGIACALLAGVPDMGKDQVDLAQAMWPFPPDKLKDKGRRQNLIRGIAMLVAEVEKIDRATP